MEFEIVTGGAGFIGTNLVRRLLSMGRHVVVVDDLSLGRRDFARGFNGVACHFVEADCANADHVLGQMRELIGETGSVRTVWHLAANSDIPAGVADPSVDLKRTFLTTFGVLELMKALKATRLNFASSSAIYGDAGDREVHEDWGPLEPISNYGAMKLASEAQIRASVEANGFEASIFRFPNVIGVPATHGVILDFVRKLHRTPGELQVLGNGTQQKPYLHVDELVEAMLHISSLDGRYKVFNIGTPDSGVSVADIAAIVRDRVSPSARIVFGEGDRGWVGDVPRFRYSIAKLAASGWSPRLTSRDAAVKAVDEIASDEAAA